MIPIRFFRAAGAAAARSAKKFSSDASRGGLSGTAASSSPLRSHEQAVEQVWANRESARQIAALAAKNAAAAAAAESKVADTKAAATPASPERVALDAIVGTRVSKDTKEKLLEWRKSTF